MQSKAILRDYVTELRQKGRRRRLIRMILRIAGAVAGVCAGVAVAYLSFKVLH